jgi:hypothetical protein
MLVNLISGDLRREFPGEVFVPGAYVPNLVSTKFGDTLIGATLNTLETDRRNLIQTADTKILSPDCQYAGDKNLAKLNQATISQITMEVTAASALVDAFEASLFGGGGGAAKNASQSNLNASGNPGGSGSAPTSRAGTPNGQLPGPSTNGSSSAQQNGSTLQQMFYADGILRTVPTTQTKDGKKRAPIYFVSVHSLESGGTTLSKASLFPGTHVYYSGGAVATFSIFGDEGAVLCSGVSYSYRGSISEDRMTDAFSDDRVPGTDPPTDASKRDDLPIVNHFTTSC